MKKILITSSKAPYCISLMSLLRAKGYTVIETPQNGEAVLRAIDSEMPDLVIMDAFMAGKDAIGVIRSLDSFIKSTPCFFVSMVFSNEKLLHELMMNGASYLLCAPYDPVMAAKIVEDYLNVSVNEFVPVEKKINAESVVALLHDMGMPPYLKGYMSLKEVIMYCLQNPDTPHAVTKVLYPAASGKVSTSYRVERNIRYALELTWEKGNKEFLEEHFPFEKGKRNCPSNAEFIAAAVEYLEFRKSSDLNLLIQR